MARADVAKRNRSAAQREAVSRFREGKPAWNSGKTGIFTLEQGKKISNSLRGNTRRKGKTMSKETRSRISKGSRAAWVNGTIDIEAFAAGRKAHAALVRVDAYLPLPYHLAFEADGEYWHQHPRRDAARDAYLLKEFSLPVIRINGSELEEVCSGPR